MTTADRQGDRTLAFSAAMIVAGALLSGPIGMLVARLHPQPPWRDAATFAAHFHPLQQVPFWFGLLLLASCVFFVVRCAVVVGQRYQTRRLAALVSVGTYA